MERIADEEINEGKTMKEKNGNCRSDKISYKTKAHTPSTMICEGIYPTGTTRDEVEEVVQGPFGGRFEYFGNGKFKYIAYID